MPEVYAAYSDWLDNVRQNAEKKYRKETASLEKRNPPDLNQRLASAQATWDKAKRSFLVKQAIIEDHKQELSWNRQDQDKVIKRLGIDKQGNIIKTDE